jgi:hypothetical protein
MRVEIKCPWRFTSELHRNASPSGVPLSSVDVTAELSDLLDEACVGGVLAETLPEQPDAIHAEIEPVFAREALVERIRVRLRTGENGCSAEHAVEFAGGRWNRTRHQRVQQLREEGSLGKDESPFHALVALPASGDSAIEPPLLQSPPIVDGTLEQFGVRSLGTGELTPDRPILINARLETDCIAACLAAGARETGAAVLGVLARLPRPLPNTSTCIVTLLTTCIEDPRHTGEVNEWHISPDALAASAQIAELRGLGESVLTVVHSHGWSTECGKCNENAACPLAECTLVSHSDYQVLETLFPGKSTVMPIVGRKLGAPGKQPVLAMHAWRGGEMRPLRFQRYAD